MHIAIRKTTFSIVNAPCAALMLNMLTAPIPPRQLKITPMPQAMKLTTMVTKSIQPARLRMTSSSSFVNGMRASDKVTSLQGADDISTPELQVEPFASEHDLIGDGDLALRELVPALGLLES